MVDEIRRGEIALPDIQRPFIWKTPKVRDLFDSMYQGFPVGFLLFWSTGAEVGARQIGTDGREAAPRLLIVDGQQRLTSLYAVLTGRPVVREDYSEACIRIAFRPDDAIFEVTDAAIEKNPQFIPDISLLWNGAGRRQEVRNFLNRLEASRGPLSVQGRDRLEEAIDRLYDLRNYPFKVVELGSEIEEEKVADIFVRINSEGIRLNTADFILTLLSVWWDKGRKQLEDFARAARDTRSSGPSPANPFIDPSPDQLLRVAAGLAFGRGRLKYVYQVLRGKDLTTEIVSPETRERQFAALKEAQEAAVDLTNWAEFLKSVTRAGYRSRAMITSENNLLFAYLMYLVGLRQFGVNRRRLREVIARWYFMTALTGRYTGNFEGQVEQDLRTVHQSTGADGFVDSLDNVIGTTLTNDFWEIALPEALNVAVAYSPALFAYNASLVLLNARPLFSRLTVAELLDPATHAPRSAVERHHLFPRAYLTKIGIEKQYLRNQIANYAFVEWPDNAAIADSAPADYFPPLFSQFSLEEQREFRFWHALPDGWEQMSYETFLEARRKLIAKVVRTAYEKLRTGQLPKAEPSLPKAAPAWPPEDLTGLTESELVELKSSLFHSYKPDIPERVVTDSVVKSVAAFLNAGGGMLAIGVSDDGEILGIGADLELKQMDVDRYVNTLTTLLERTLGGAAASLAKVRMHEAEGQKVCIVHIDPSPVPVFARVSKGDQVFFVRINNSTRVLEGADLVGYVRQRWG